MVQVGSDLEETNPLSIIQPVPAQVEPPVYEERLRAACGSDASTYKDCIDGLVAEAKVGSRQVTLAEEYSRLLSECKTEVDGYKAAGDRTVYVTKDDEKTLAALQSAQSALASEREKGEGKERELAKMTSERDGYKTIYEAKQAVIDKQWKECKLAAEAAPSIYLLLAEPEWGKKHLQNFCTTTYSFVLENGFVYQEEIDRVADSMTKSDNAEVFFYYSQKCDEYGKLPHDPRGPWKEKQSQE
jgi:hypothetical protein